MAASKVKLAIEQGATFRKRFTWLTGTPAAPVDLTGFTARSQVRADVDAPAVLVEMNTENGGIVLGAGPGTIDLYIAADNTAVFTWESGVYDLELVAPGGDVTRLVAGPVSVSREVTRV